MKLIYPAAAAICALNFNSVNAVPANRGQSSKFAKFCPPKNRTNISCLTNGVLDESCHDNYLQCHSLSGKKMIGKCLTLKFGKDRARIACIEENEDQDENENQNQNGGQNNAPKGPRKDSQRSQNQFSVGSKGTRPGTGKYGNNQSQQNQNQKRPFYSDHNKLRQFNGPSPNINSPLLGQSSRPTKAQSSKLKQNLAMQKQFNQATKTGTWDGADKASTNDKDSHRVTYGRDNNYQYNYSEKIQESYDHKENLGDKLNPEKNLNLIAQVIEELAKEQPEAAQHFKDMWELRQESKQNGVPIPKPILNEMTSFKLKFMMDNPKWAAMFREAKRRQYNAKLKLQGVTGHNIHEKKEKNTNTNDDDNSASSESNKNVPNRNNNKGGNKKKKFKKGPKRSKGKGMMARSFALVNIDDEENDNFIQSNDENLVKAEITPEMMAMVDIWKNSFPILEQGPYNNFNRDIDTYLDSIQEGVVDYLALNGLNKFFMMHGLEKLGEWSRFKEIVKTQGLMF